MKPAALAIFVVGAAIVAASADAGRRAKKRGNMPPGFVWPPSAAMREAGRRCLADLDALGLRWSPGRATRQVATPVVLPDMAFGPVALTPTFRKGPFVMDCHLARGLARKATELAAAGVTELRFSTIHELRQIRVRGRTGKLPLSRHSLGLAIDLFEIVDRDGRRLIVEDDYRREPLIREVEALFKDDADFRGPLSPANDPRSHRDHIHLEAVQGPREASARLAGSAEEAR
jgi:hypothetical protein